MIGRFNKKRFEVVAAGAKKTADETIFAFKPRASATANVDHLTKVLGKPKDFGFEMKNVVCCAIRVMLFLELQEGKLPMQEKKYSKEFGSNQGCTIRIAEAAARCGQVIRNTTRTTTTTDDLQNNKSDLFIADSFFGGTHSVVELAKKGHDSIMAIKNNYAFLLKKANEKTMADYPAGAYLVFESTVDDIPVVFLSYKYNAKRVVHFLMTKDAGSTKPDPAYPYVARWADKYGNVKSREIPRPSVLSSYWKDSNNIDLINQECQKYLALEEKWITQDGFKRFCTLYVGQNVIDTRNALCYGLPSMHGIQKLTTKAFANHLVYGMRNGLYSHQTSLARPMIPLLRIDMENESEERSPTSPLSFSSTNTPVSTTSTTTTTESVHSINNSIPPGAPSISIDFLEKHQIAKTTKMCKDGSRVLRKGCKIPCCASRSEYYCVGCGKAFCEDGQGKNNVRYCFYEHIAHCYMVSGYASANFNLVYQSWKENLQN